MKSKDTNAISMFHAYRLKLLREALLTNTYEDLNLEYFFHTINHTSSCIGEQYLYHILHYDKASGVDKHEALLNKLKEEKEYREHIIKHLKKLNHSDAYHITSLFSRPFPIAPKWEMHLLRVCRFIPFFLAGIFTLYQTPLLFLLFILSIVGNTILHYRNKIKIQEYCFAIPQLIKMLQTAEALTQQTELIKIDTEIEATLAHLTALKKTLATFKLSIHLESDMALLAYMFTELFNILFLSEAYTINQAFIRLKEKNKKIEQTFCFIGMIDTLCAISLLRESLPYYCLPEESKENNTLTAQKTFHPLIHKGVANNIHLKNKSMLITGSNMSGKTSFIRTLGINLLSAKILHTCFAERFCYPADMHIASSIHISDNLMGGKSFFLQEVELMKELLELSNKGNSLFLIDEPFKGTNTTERIAIGKAVLAALAQNQNIVIVSTHDLELTGLLAPQYESYYFCETVENNHLSFDYKLKKGVATERNAIKILEIYDYPPSIVKEANAIANTQS